MFKPQLFHQELFSFLLLNTFKHFKLYIIKLNYYDRKLFIYLICIFIARKIVIEGCKEANGQTFTKIGESKEIGQRNGM